jgi:hypothetical protein
MEDLRLAPPPPTTRPTLQTMAAVAMVVTQPVDMAQSSMLFLAAPVPVAGKAGALNAESLAAESKRWKAKNIEGNTHTDVFKKKYKKPLQS